MFFLKKEFLKEQKIFKMIKILYIFHKKYFFEKIYLSNFGVRGLCIDPFLTPKKPEIPAFFYFLGMNVSRTAIHNVYSFLMPFGNIFEYSFCKSINCFENFICSVSVLASKKPMKAISNF